MHVLVLVPVRALVLVVVHVHEHVLPITAPRGHLAISTPAHAPSASIDRYGVMLDHERLDAYQCALQYATLAFQVLQSLPRGHSELADQLRRAAVSVPLNIAEGSGKTTARERARFHAIARGSAMECAAILDVLKLQGLVEPEVAAEAKRLSVRLVAMLTKMCR